MSYAFQIYALFVASAGQNNDVFKSLTDSILSNKDNWNKEMKFLIPSLGQFLISMMCKFPEDMKVYSTQIGEIIIHLLGTEVRMESTAMQIASVLFERIGIFSEDIVQKVLFQIFTTMHFYRNNTKNKIIPIAITKSIIIFFATFMVNFGEDMLIGACDKIQANILFQILKSEGDKIKFCATPPRDRKYAIVAYTNLVCNKSQSFMEESIKSVI
jgi:hypothetical protein